MDAHRFDALARWLTNRSSRRTTVSIALGGVLLSLGAASTEAKPCKKRCGVCKQCNRKTGKCVAKLNNTPCGRGKVCRGGQCVCPTECCTNGDCRGFEECVQGQCVCNQACCVNADCEADESCEQGQCVCKFECCANRDCPQGEVCCLNENRCRDVRNDRETCGTCQNAKCQGGAFCANGDCGLSCNTIGQGCFDGSLCKCGSRVDPAHAGEKVCATERPANCNLAQTCDDDGDCGFRKVCVSGICAGKNVCADPCA